MPLDVFQQSSDEQIALAGRYSETELPAEFGEGFSTAWRDSRLFGQSIAGENARREALDDYAAQLSKRAGYDVTASFTLQPSDSSSVILDRLNGIAAELKSKSADFDVEPLSEQDLDQRAVTLSRGARSDYAALAAREKTLGGKIGTVLGSVAGGFTDPVNVVALGLAPPEGASVLATALGWSAIGFSSQAGVEIAGMPYREKVQPGYAASGEPAGNVLAAAAFGGALGGGIKGLGAIWSRVKAGIWARGIRDAGNVVESESQVAATNRFPGVEGEVAHRTALQDAIDALVEGRPVEAEKTVTPSILRAYEARLDPVMEARAKASAAQESAVALERDDARLPPQMERLSEQQLADIRASGRAIDTEAQALQEGLAAERQRVESGRTQLGAQDEQLAARRAELEGLQRDLAGVQQRLAEARPPTDPATEARLSQIDTELSVPALGAGQRAALQAERSAITETLAKTAPADARLIASLQQEEKALGRALTRQQQQIARLEASRAKAVDKLASAEAALPRREGAGTARIAGRREAVRTEMRRAISRLAAEGYGLRLPRTDAEAFADRILSASDVEAETRLRELTETLVDRAAELKRAEPTADIFGTPRPAAQKAAEASYWTEQMRKGITALAREVGYAMPRDEAAAIAAHVAKLPEREALAVLDELMLRPRTLAQTLPGSAAIREMTLPAGARIVGEGELGPIVRGLEGRLADAVAWLRANQTGDVAGVLSHADVPGRIDLVWGDENFGIAHIDRAHPGDLDRLAQFWDGLKVKKEGPSRIVLESDAARAVIAKNFRGDAKTWMLTYVEFGRPEGKTIDGAPVKGPTLASSGRPATANIGENGVFGNAATDALKIELSPKKIAEIPQAPETDDTVLRDLDRLRAEKGDIDVPFGTAFDESGNPVAQQRNIAAVIEEADARLAAAREIAACAGPQPGEGA